MFKAIVLVAGVAIGGLALPGFAQAQSCQGACGVDGADGNIPLSPLGNPTYQYVTTTGGLDGVGVNPLGDVDPTNGSLLQSALFSANAGAMLTFYFNYITSDGFQFPDNGWAALYTSSGQLVTELYNSTTVNTINNPNATTVSWLGQWSGQCYDVGCGNTGWEEANYAITTAGEYYLAFGVTNSMDELYDSGLAIDGIEINGQPIPEPAAAGFLVLGLAAIGVARRRRAS